MEERSKLTVGTKEARKTGDPWPHLEVKRSKVTSQNGFSFAARLTGGGAVWRTSL